MNLKQLWCNWKSFVFVGCVICLPLSVKAGDTATVDSFKVASTYTGKPTTDAFGRSVASTTIRWRLYVPKGYDPSAAATYPLVFTLHGVGEGGTDNRLQLKYRFNRMWADDTMQAKQKMFVLAPQNVNSSTTWTLVASTTTPVSYATQTINPGLSAAVQLLDSLLVAYKIDTNRLYLSGESSGGYGTWYLMARYPKRWAAALPDAACADTNQAVVNTFLATPIWIFHGSADPTVNVNCGRQMIASLRRAYAAASKDTTNTLRYSEYAGVQHNSWENASRDPKVMPWTVSKSVTTNSVAIHHNFRKPVNTSGHLSTVKKVDGLGRQDDKSPSLKTFKIGNK